MMFKLFRFLMIFPLLPIILFIGLVITDNGEDYKDLILFCLFGD